MKRITSEEGLALIERYQQKNLKGLDPNDATASYKTLMKTHQYAYHFEASTDEPSYYGANRTRLLLEQIEPEIKELGFRPVYYYVILLPTQRARFMIDDFDALGNFMQANEDIEKGWALHEIDGDSCIITMHIIAIMD